MQRYIIVLFWILILAVILLSVPSKCTLSNGVKKEGFTDYYGYYKQYCPSCNWRGLSSCGKCTNCGICVTEAGQASCAAGDASGPYFRSDCDKWSYGDDQTFYAGANVYPTVQMRNIYPYNRWNLNRSLRPPHKKRILA